MSPSPAPGTILWHDLTVADAAPLRDFYAEVVGWQPEAVAMDGYDDYTMVTPAGESNAGICHARGGNADIPPQWLIYFAVADVERSAAAVVAGGGTLLREVGPLAGGRFCVIRDPAGAVCALYQPAAGD